MARAIPVEQIYTEGGRSGALYCSAPESAAKGFVVGFVLAGGAVALHRAVCAPDSWSRRNQLCG